MYTGRGERRHGQCLLDWKTLSGIGIYEDGRIDLLVHQVLSHRV